MQPITIILTDHYSDWEIAPLSGAGRAFYEADIRLVSPDGGVLTSVAGLSVTDLAAFTPPDEGVVVVCGGPAFETGSPPDLSARLKRARENGCIIAGICGGTIALARAGLLDDVAHTSNHPGYLEDNAPAYAGRKHYVDQPAALRSGFIITAPAPAPVSFAAEILTAAGLEPDKVHQFRTLLAAEHAG
jgi:putative intracellular protease/amidase